MKHICLFFLLLTMGHHVEAQRNRIFSGYELNSFIGSVLVTNTFAVKGMGTYTGTTDSCLWIDRTTGLVYMRKSASGTTDTSGLGLLSRYAASTLYALKTITINGHALSANVTLTPTDLDASVSIAEYGYLDGVTSSIQSQINGKQAALTTGSAAQYIKGDLTLGTFPTALSAFTNDPGYITGNQSITLSGDLSGSGTTSISGTVTGLRGSSVPALSTGFLKYNGSAWVYDNTSYLSSETDPAAALKANNLNDLGNAATARTNLGATTVGSNIFTLANPGAITFLRLNADNSVTARSAANFRSDIGAGTGNGSVTGISVASSNGFTGTSDGNVSTPTITLTTSITGILQGNGTAISAATTTGTGSVVQATSPVLNFPTIGIAGTGGSSHIKTVGTAPSVSATGLGGSNTVALETGSTDAAGVITLTTGNSGTGSTGTITLTFNSAYVNNQPVIMLTLVSGGTAWGTLATIKQTTQSLTAPVFTWNNSATGAAVALTTSTTYKVAYMVLQK